MSRSKYINTFNTTAEYENYIESALPEFPNVGYDKQAGVVNIRRQQRNDYVIWGTVVDITTPVTFKFNKTTMGSLGTSITSTNDTLENIYYITQQDFNNVSITSMKYLLYANKNIKSFNKFDYDLSNCTTLYQCFNSCSNLESVNFGGLNFPNNVDLTDTWSNCTSLKTLNLLGCDFSNAICQSTFTSCNSLTDVYIDVEGTLMQLTKNLTSANTHYFPSSATIHYNDVDYVWSGSAWTIQS